MDKIQLGFSFLLVIATIIYVYYTYKLVQESRKSREIALKPKIIIYLDSAETEPSSQYLNIRNVGKGLAINVNFEIIKDLDILTKYDRTLKSQKYLNRTYSNFPPEYLFRNHAFDLSNNYSEKIKSNIIIKCTYKDIFNEKYDETFNLNLSDGFGRSKLTPPHTYLGLISYELKKLNKTIEKMNIPSVKELDKD